MGGEAAFSGEYDLRNRTAGALFAGPPNFNPLYRDFTDDRDGGSPEVAPIFRAGRTVRFDDDPKPGAEPASAPWNGTRVLYLQHPSDPIVWWSPRLVLNRPAWLREPAGRDVLDEMVWIPFVTFWQVTADFPFATGVPGGHGHKGTTEYVDPWAAVLPRGNRSPASRRGRASSPRRGRPRAAHLRRYAAVVPPQHHGPPQQPAAEPGVRGFHLIRQRRLSWSHGAIMAP